MKKLKNTYSTNAPINVVEISDTTFTAKYADRIRHGKTQRDHKSGAWKQRFINREMRTNALQNTPWNKTLPF